MIDALHSIRVPTALLAVAVFILILDREASAGQGEVGVCRPEAEFSAPIEVVLPGGDPFTPPIAGAGEPRISLGLVRTHLSGTPAASGSGSSDFTAGVVSGGAVFGLWARRADCADVQVSLLGGVFSQFNMDDPSQALINSDFLVGGQVTWRRGRVSSRVRVYHQSSHLGDEFILRNPRVARVDFGFQAVDGLVALDHDLWRVYAGGGVRVFSHADPGPGVLRGGIEAQQRPTRGRRPRAVAAVDLTAHQALDWRSAVTGAGGFEWTGSSSGRRLRALVIAFNGPSPWGQFFDERVRHVGAQLQFEF